MAARVLVLDTDVLLKLALNPANVEAAEHLHVLIQGGSFELVLPENVLRAFARLQNEQCERIISAVKKQVDEFRKEVLKLVSQPEQVDMCLDAIGKNLDTFSTRLNPVREIVSQIMARARVTPEDGRMIAEAGERMRAGRAPATKCRPSSVNDCIVWSVVLAEGLKGPVTFCSDNRKDFAASDSREPHAQLADEIRRLNIELEFFTLDTFQKKYLERAPILDSHFQVVCVHCLRTFEPDGNDGVGYIFCPNCHKPSYW